MPVLYVLLIRNVSCMHALFILFIFGPLFVLHALILSLGLNHCVC